MEEEDEYILDSDLPVVPAYALESWSDSDYDYDDDDDEYEYDKTGRRCWKKKQKYKGDDPSKAIHWSKMYPNFDYDQLDRRQLSMAGKVQFKNISENLTNAHSIRNTISIFETIFGRRPGWYRRCVYVRNVTDCDYYCDQLLKSPILPGIVGVDIEMENDKVGYRNWDPKWRTIRAHSRMAKGMFARLLQVANCCGLVVVFDLYALARPHSWDGGIEMDMRSRNGIRRIPLPTSSLPPSLVHLLLDPNVIRFGWALHCDWSALYNSFGLVVPQTSYLDGQAPWRFDLKRKLEHNGNGLAHAALALFGIHLDKSLRGYGHFWHGRPPRGIIPWNMVQYAAIDAQTSLDVAVYLLVRTDWLRDWGNVWMSSHVKSQPMPGVRKRVMAVFGIWEDEEPRVKRFRRVISDEGASSDSGLGKDEEGEGEMEGRMENEPGKCEEMKEEDEEQDEHGAVEEEGWPETKKEMDEDFQDGETSTRPSNFQTEAESSGIIFPNFRITKSGSDRIIRMDPSDHREMETDDVKTWKALSPVARNYIIKSKHEAKNIFKELASHASQWAWCPAFMMLRTVKQQVLKRMIMNDARAGERRRPIREACGLYRRARWLFDCNLQWAWKQTGMGKGKCNIWNECKKFQRKFMKKTAELVMGSISKKELEKGKWKGKNSSTNGFALTNVILSSIQKT